MNPLADLLARVEAADGPVKFGWVPGVGDELVAVGRTLGVTDGAGLSFIHNGFGGSLDAALALCERVLPGWAWSYHSDAGAKVWNNNFLNDMEEASGDAETPALALLAAMLKAKLAEAKA